MNPKLLDAVDIFKTLGWENATTENVLQLPTGTPGQKRTALAGLKNGEWGEFAKTGKNSYSWRSYVDVDTGKLALFAVRIGVDARRAVTILRNADNEMILKTIAGRGAKYASDFIGFACVSRRRALEHSASAFGNVVVRLVDALNLAIPQTVEYMKDWSVYAAAAMGLKAETHYKETDFPGIDLIRKRFVEHIMTGVAVNAPATGPFGAVLPAGVKCGWLERGKALQLVFSALDAAVRPADRKVWLDVLNKLDITDDEFCERTQALIPLLTSGDVVVIERLAPLFITRAGDALLAEVLLAAFSATAKKTRLLVLKSALGRLSPKNTEDLAPWLSILAGDKDKAVSSLAVRLMKQWEIHAELLPEEKTEVQGLWRETPPVWKIPPFELGELRPEALTELAAELVNRPAVVHDVTLERFLAMANALAFQDPEATRNSLRGLRPDDSFFDFAVHWVKAEKPNYGFDTKEKTGTRDPLTARDYAAFLHLDKLPCLLSSPSVVDLSISVDDLAGRLALYKKAGIDVQEADLFLALMRLDLKTKTPKSSETLRSLDVPIVLQSGEKISVTAGQAVLAYLDDPVREPSLKAGKDNHWDKTKIAKPDSLLGFPNRFSWYPQELFSVFPHWGDEALHEVRWDSEVYHDKGLVLRQIARRAAPLPPGASINFLAAQRSHTPDAAEDAMLAVTEAWERGLLRPGVADAALLDWSTKPPTNLAALAGALDGIARDGLLSVVWPVLDALIETSLEAPRLLAGTAELAELIAAFLPEVQSAVEQGAADMSALDLPGIRALAQQGGSSRAVSAAKKVSTLLPPVKTAPKSKMDEKPAQLLKPPFDKVWPRCKENALFIDDGVKVTVEWYNPDSPSKLFLFTLSLPGISDRNPSPKGEVPLRVFHVVNSGWIYDLETEGQCNAYPAEPGVFKVNKENQVWLHWDAERKAMVACDKRNWREGKNSPLTGEKPPLSSSLVTVIIGLLAQDGDAVYYAPRLLQKLIENGQIDAAVVQKTVRILLQNPVVSPAKLVRSLEKDVKLLPVLWPMLTEYTKRAGAMAAADGTPPVWINRILDNALRYAPYLKEAAKRGLMGKEDLQWAGLSEIASSKAKSTAVAKAKKLMAILK